METYQELIDRLAAITAEASKVFEVAEKEEGGLTAEQLTRLDAIEGETTDLKRKVKVYDLQHQREAELAGQQAAASGAAQTSNFHDNREDKPWESMGAFLYAVGRAGRNEAFDPRLGIAAAATGMGEATPSDGGFAVQKDYANDLLSRGRGGSVLYPLVRKATIGPNSNGLKALVVDETSLVDGSRGGGVQFFWSDEGSAATATQPKLRLLNVDLMSCKALCYATDEMLADASILNSWIGDEYAKEAGEEIDNNIINGSGAGRPMGILNAAALVSVAKESGQAAATFIFENAVKMLARNNGGSLVWIYNRNVIPQLFAMQLPVGTGGTALFIAPGAVGAAPSRSLLGDPLLEMKHCASLGTKGDVILADMSRYLWIEKGNLQADVSMHVRFIQHEQTFRFIFRANGQPIPATAITPAKGGASSTLSPFTTTATRS